MLEGFNTQQSQRRRYPLPPDQVFDALVTVVVRDYNLTSTDSLTRTVVFSAHESLLTWGENITAMVIPADGGCDVDVSGVGKVGGQVQQATALITTFAHLFEKVSAQLTAGE